jgi:RNA polymerase sigma-70 factor (ECF subfamily)
LRGFPATIKRRRFPATAILSPPAIVIIAGILEVIVGPRGVNLPPDCTEEDLIRKAQKGDREAFALLYEAHAARVYQYLLHKLGQPADAEDVTAEVFIRAMEALPSYQIRGVPFIAWLMRISHNSAINHFKRNGRRKEVILDDWDAISTDDPAELAVQQATFEEVSRAMKGLTALQQQALNLRFISQLTTAETASQMDRTVRAVKFLQHSAIRALRRRLGGQENS